MTPGRTPHVPALNRSGSVPLPFGSTCPTCSLQDGSFFRSPSLHFAFSPGPLDSGTSFRWLPYLRFMKRTRIPSLFLVLFALVGLLSACGGDKGTSSESSQGSTSDASKLAAATLNASGATFPKAFYEEVIAEFSEKHSGVTINYGGGGSGKGRTDLQTGVVDFAGSDGLVKAEDVAEVQGRRSSTSRPSRRRSRCPTTSPASTSLQLVARHDRQDLPARDQDLERPGHRRRQPRRQAPVDGDHRRPPLRRLGHHRELHQVPQGRRSRPSWTLTSGSTVEWPADTQAGNGNSGVAQIVKQQQRRHRLRRPLRRQGHRPQVRQGQEQGGQVRRRRRWTAPPPRWPASRSTPTSATTRCGRRRRGLPDHRPDLDPRLQEPDRQGQGRGPQGLPPLHPTATARSWPARSTTPSCPTPCKQKALAQVDQLVIPA